MQTVRADALRIAPDRGRVTDMLIEIAACLRRFLIAPWENPPIGAARRLLPFGLGRQPHSRPATKSDGIVPRDTGHRMRLLLLHIALRPSRMLPVGP